MSKPLVCVASIAGSDASGGAGIQADIKTISATGCYAASIITVLTAQNTQGVHAIQTVPPEFVAQQIEAVLSDLDVRAIKIGMLYSIEIMEVVAQAIRKYKPAHVVLDPVMIAKNGCELLPKETINFFKCTLFPLTRLITPNVPEAEKLTTLTIKNQEQQLAAAKKLAQDFQTNVLVKGGHMQSVQASDVFYNFNEDSYEWFHAARIDSHHTHGTGCSLSSAIASYLAQGSNLNQAIHAAKTYLTHAISFGKTQQIGKGRGPIHHFYFLEKDYDISRND